MTKPIKSMHCTPKQPGRWLIRMPGRGYDVLSVKGRKDTELRAHNESIVLLIVRYTGPYNCSWVLLPTYHQLAYTSSFVYTYICSWYTADRLKLAESFWTRVCKDMESLTETRGRTQTAPLCCVCICTDYLRLFGGIRHQRARAVI